MRCSKVKVWEGNYDGSRRAMVIATSQKSAAKVLGCGVKQLQDYYYVSTDVPPGYHIETLYTKPFDGPGEWVKGYCKIERRPAVAGKEES